jgi:hypothetical protein
MHFDFLLTIDLYAQYVEMVLPLSLHPEQKTMMTRLKKPEQSGAQKQVVGVVAVDVQVREFQLGENEIVVAAAAAAAVVVDFDVIADWLIVLMVYRQAR